MKVFTKIALAVALIFVVVGSMLCAIGLGIGFQFSEFWDQVEEGEFSIGPIRHIPFISYGNTGFSWDDWDSWGFDWEEGDFDWEEGNYDWVAQDKQDFSFSWENIQKIELDLDYSGVKVLEDKAAGENILVNVGYRNKSHKHEVKAYMDGGTLKIQDSGNRNWRKDSSMVVLTIPSGIMEHGWLEKIELKQGKGYINVGMPLTAKEISIKVGAGECVVSEKLTAEKEISVNVDAGEISLEELEANKVKLEGGVGELTASLLTADTIEIEGGVGNIEVEAAGEEADYSYDIQCGVGTVEIGDHEYSGLSSGGAINNPGNKKIEIDCGIGNVEVSFQGR